MPTVRPKKRFGQHFLRDMRVVERIAAAFAPQPADHVVEIGPGEGVLTHALVGRVARLDLVELDRDLAAQLSQTYADAPAITVHQADALKFDFRALAAPGETLRLIGNLPYNISTPLLFHALAQAESVRDMLFMLQKEVVERLSAAPGGKDYGRLSVMVQWRCRVEKLFTVPPGAFHPPPKVDSAVVRLTPHARPPVAVRDPETFARVVQAAFAQRRKTLRNSLKGVVSAEAMSALGIDPIRRAETLSLQEFAALSNL
jgi:16S rRNA (adenine1518-N6/adenine1519-N6)-dimethyltransferase